MGCRLLRNLRAFAAHELKRDAADHVERTSAVQLVRSVTWTPKLSEEVAPKRFISCFFEKILSKTMLYGNTDKWF